MNAVRWLALLLIVAAVLWVRIVPRVFHESGLVSSTDVTTTYKAVDDAAAVVARFGKPDSDRVDPGPSGAVPTRVLTYRDLRIVFTERESLEGKPWKLVGFVDAKSGMTLSGDEALKRLLARK
jgi:hypothetical protein